MTLARARTVHTRDLERHLPLEPGLSTDVTRHTGDFAATMPSPPIEAAREND